MGGQRTKNPRIALMRGSLLINYLCLCTGYFQIAWPYTILVVPIGEG